MNDRAANTYRLLLTTVSLIAVACGPVADGQSPVPNSVSNFKITGGTEVSNSDPIASHTVLFMDPSGNIGCSGVIVGPNQILSAGHCWGDTLWDDVHVVFATRAADARFGTADANTRRVVTGVHHEGYTETFGDPKTPPFDIALVTFEGSLPSGKEPVTIFDTQLKIPVGTEVFLAGFGMTADQENSPRRLRAVSTILGSQNLRKKEFYFGPTPGRGPCGGDSGGPAFVKAKGQLHLIGITSRGTPDSDTCLDGKAIYTDVRFFQEWAEARGNFKMKVSSATVF